MTCSEYSMCHERLRIEVLGQGLEYNRGLLTGLNPYIYTEIDIDI